MDQAAAPILVPLKNFAKESQRLLNKCTKPDGKEFTRTAVASLAGLAIIGMIGFVVKLTFIPINNMILG